jgi:serine protease inhibitor
MNRSSLSRSVRFWFVCLSTLSLSVPLLNASSADQDQLASANTGFAFKLLTAIAREQPEKNIFISPYSVSTVLQMVENGAAGKTKEELRQALGITNLSQAAQNEANRDLSRAINASTTNLILNTANAIWYRTGISVKPAFIACNQDF